MVASKKETKKQKTTRKFRVPTLSLQELQRTVREALQLRTDDFDTEYDYVYTKKKAAAAAKRGSATYQPPKGFAKLGLSVLGKYSSDAWLSRKAGWPIVYHGTRARPCIIRSIVREGFKPAGGKAEAFNGSRFGSGIYCSPNSRFAASYSKQKKLSARSSEEEYRVVFMCRVKPGSWREETDDIWVVDNPRNIRPFGLLLSSVEVLSDG